MRALVKYGSRNGEVEVREQPEPSVQPGRASINVKAAGVCGSDLHMWRIRTVGRLSCARSGA